MEYIQNILKLKPSKLFLNAFLLSGPSSRALFGHKPYRFVSFKGFGRKFFQPAIYKNSLFELINYKNKVFISVYT